MSGVHVIHREDGLVYLKNEDGTPFHPLVVPNFLVNPLSCPPGRCRHVSSIALPSQPIPAQLSKDLADCFTTVLQTTTYDLVSPPQNVRLTHAIELLISFAKKQPSLRAFAASLAEGRPELAELMDMTEQVARLLGGMTGLTPEKRNEFAATFFRYDFVDKAFREFLETACGTDPCLHDVIDPRIDWTRLKSELEETQSEIKSSYAGNVDMGALLRRFRKGSESGELKGEGWTEGGDGMEVVREVCGRIVSRLGYLTFASYPDFVLRLLALVNGPSDYSAEIGHLIVMCELPTEAQCKIQEQAPIACKSLPANVELSGKERLAQISRLSPPSFAHYKISSTRSRVFPHVAIYPLPRLHCPPDICSGVSPIVSNYDKVDEHLQSIFRNLILKELVQLYALDYGTRRDQYVGVIIAGSRVDHFAMNQDNYADLKACLAEPTRHLFGPESADELIDDAARRFKNVIPKSGMLCVCELTHCVTDLKTVAIRTEASTTAAIRSSFNRLKTNSPPININQVVTALENMVRGGNVSGRRWRGDWPSQVRDWIPKVLVEVERKMLDSAQFVAYSAQFDDCWRIVGSLGLLQLARIGHAGDLSRSLMYTILVGQELTADTAARGKIMADNEFRSNLTAMTVLNYEIVYGLNRLDSSATLNCAAARLRLANDTDQSYQWSDAIHDCTMALYYGGPNFKAYFRRGYALAHLKMYKKAIVDFEKALVLEPRNVVVERQLALARKKL